jgi:enoyl-CoA hydratase/carnithine racemase
MDLNVVRNAGIVELTFNRPAKLNAITESMMLQLQDELRRFALDADDRVMVLSGAGGNFSSGGDMSAPDPETHRLDRLRITAATAIALHRVPKPTIAKVDGVAVGAGANIAFGCDFVIATPTARFSEIFIERALSLDFGGSWLLPRLIGLQRAKELAYFGAFVNGEEALAMGLVTRLVPQEDLDAVVQDWAERLVQRPRIALSLNKELLNASFESSFEAAAEAEGRCQTVNFATPDITAGLSRFRD